MARERAFWTNQPPIFLDPPPQSRAAVQFPIDCSPVRTYLIQHPRLGRFRISARDYRGVDIDGPVLSAYEVGGAQLFDGDGNAVTALP
jgi:hypothetical protein